MRHFSLIVVVSVLAALPFASTGHSQSVSVDHIDGVAWWDSTMIVAGEQTAFWIRLTNSTSTKALDQGLALF